MDDLQNSRCFDVVEGMVNQNCQEMLQLKKLVSSLRSGSEDLVRKDELSNYATREAVQNTLQQIKEQVIKFQEREKARKFH